MRNQYSVIFLRYLDNRSRNNRPPLLENHPRPKMPPENRPRIIYLEEENYLVKRSRIKANGKSLHLYQFLSSHAVIFHTIVDSARYSHSTRMSIFIFQFSHTFSVNFLTLPGQSPIYLCFSSFPNFTADPRSDKLFRLL